MILLDPDLDPDPSPHSFAAKTPSGRDAVRLPSIRTLTRFLREAQAAVRLRGQVAVLLTGDAAIRRLNRRFRGKHKATDVLSFPAGPGPEKLAGDLVISVETARKQAVARGHSLATEIKILMLHGLLHLAGYDHESDEGEMARRERKLRERLRLREGLIERAGSEAARNKSGTSKPGRRVPRSIEKATAGSAGRLPRQPSQDERSRVRARRQSAEQTIATTRSARSARP